MCGTTCYVQSATYTPLGQPAKRTLIANGLTSTWEYNSPMQRLQNFVIGTVAAPTSITRRGYTYDPGGNIKTILDAVWGQTQNFTYDARDRLTNAQTTGSAGAAGMAYNISTSYDVLGNLKSKTGVGDYTYGPTNSGPHQVRSTRLTPTATPINYTYDANGNMASGAGWGYTWNADNTLASLGTGAYVENYTYDADGERVVRTAGGVTTAYFEGVWEQTTTGARTLYYTFNGDTVAMRNAGGVQYLQGDHLGSMTWAFNASGGIIYGQEYGPWGQVRAGSMGTTLNFTGQRQDSTGLLYYHARYYNPVLARFISADTVVPGAGALKGLTVDFHEPGFVATLGGENGQPFWFQMSGQQQQQAGSPWGPANPQNLNRYSYVNNNPVNATDPTGHSIYMSHGQAAQFVKYLREYATELYRQSQDPSNVGESILAQIVENVGGILGEIVAGLFEALQGIGADRIAAIYALAQYVEGVNNVSPDGIALATGANSRYMNPFAINAYILNRSTGEVTPMPLSYSGLRTVFGVGNKWDIGIAYGDDPAHGAYVFEDDVNGRGIGPENYCPPNAHSC